MTATLFLCSQGVESILYWTHPPRFLFNSFFIVIFYISFNSFFKLIKTVICSSVIHFLLTELHITVLKFRNTFLALKYQRNFPSQNYRSSSLCETYFEKFGFLLVPTNMNSFDMPNFCLSEMFF